MRQREIVDVLVTQGDDGMREAPWFKVWSKSALGSVDLAQLTDHEERVWWRLLMVGNESTPRWTITTPNDVLARMCMSTPVKLRAALAKLISLGMVEAGDGYVRICNAERYQDSPEASKKRRYRNRRRSVDVDKQVDMSTRMSTDMSTTEDRGQRTEDRGQRTEASAVADSEDITVREVRDTLLSRLPAKFQADPVTFDEAESLARSLLKRFPETVEAYRNLNTAIDAARDAGGLPFPAKIRDHLPSLKAPPKGEVIHNPWE